MCPCSCIHPGEFFNVILVSCPKVTIILASLVASAVFLFSKWCYYLTQLIIDTIDPAFIVPDMLSAPNVLYPAHLSIVRHSQDDQSILIKPQVLVRTNIFKS